MTTRRRPSTHAFPGKSFRRSGLPDWRCGPWSWARWRQSMAGRDADADGLVLHQGGAGDFRRCLRRAAVRGPGGGGAISLAHRAADDRRAGARRNDARAAHHGSGLRRFHWGRRCRGARGDVLHLPALVHLHLHGCALHRDYARRPAVHRAADRNHGRRGGGDPQSRAVLRLPRAVARRALRSFRLAFGRHRRGRLCRVVPLQGRHNSGHRRVRCARPRRQALALGEPMSAYVIAEIEITDPAAYEEYRRQVPAVVGRYGGKYTVRGGKVEPLEGGWSPKRLAVLEFPTLEEALKWYRSPEYAPLIKLRQKASRGRMVLVEGTA